MDAEKSFTNRRLGGSYWIAIPPPVALWIGLMAVGLAIPCAAQSVPSVFTKHAVVAQEANAASAGREILQHGGNALDAAIATAFALAVTLPEAGNLGGGGFIVFYQAGSGEVVTVDFRERAPLSATSRMYLDSQGRLIPGNRSGAWAAGVPGSVRGLGLAHSRWGKRPWADLVKPAAKLAREGFLISADLAGSLNSQLRSRPRSGSRPERGVDYGRLSDFPESIAAFGRSDHGEWKAGDRLIQPDLASTLERIADKGPDEFYTGQTAKLLVRYMQDHNGRVTAEDLKSYEAKVRPPVRTSFRGHDVWSMGPPSSGGVVLCQMLNILERFDLKADGRESPSTIHRVTEAMRRAYYTRATKLADPDFVAVPVDELTSKGIANDLASTIRDQATPSETLASFPILDRESDHTTHLSAIDSAGNAVALTTTLEDSYGAKAVVAGAGFLLNNEMGDFNLIPGHTDRDGRIGTPANLIEPGKRMLSSMTPTIITKDNKVRVVTGSPGGRTIPNTTLWVVLNLLEFKMDPQASVAAPRTHHQWFPDELFMESDTWPQATRTALVAMGHKLRMIQHQGNSNTLTVDPATGAIHGCPDPRRSTTAAAGD